MYLVKPQHKINITAELDADLALTLAKLLKRIGYADYRKLATTDNEAYAMQVAGFEIQSALADAGVISQ